MRKVIYWHLRKRACWEILFRLSKYRYMLEWYIPGTYLTHKKSGYAFLKLRDCPQGAGGMWGCLKNHIQIPKLFFLFPRKNKTIWLTWRPFSHPMLNIRNYPVRGLTKPGIWICELDHSVQSYRLKSGFDYLVATGQTWEKAFAVEHT